MSRLLRTMTPETIAQALAIAVDLHEAGVHDRAEALLRRVLAADASNTLALYALGRLLRDLGRVEEALEPLALCRTLLPGSAPVALACAGALAELGRSAEAVVLLDASGPASTDESLKSLLAQAGPRSPPTGNSTTTIRSIPGSTPSSATTAARRTASAIGATGRCCSVPMPSMPPKASISAPATSTAASTSRCCSATGRSVAPKT